MLPLTKPQGEDMALKQSATVPGMAFWAMTGPEGVTCRECVFWGWTKKFRRDRWGHLAPRLCSKYIRMSGGKKGDGVPHDAYACKYFEKNPKPPAAVRARLNEE